MAIQKSPGERIFKAINNLLLILLMLITAYPLLYVTFASISEPSLIVKHTGILYRPLGFSLSAYKAVFNNLSIRSGYFNTLFYTGIGTCINVFLTILGAYALSYKKAYWRNYMVVFVVFTMFFSGGLIPSYLLVMNLKMVDTRWALIIPEAISVWNMIIMKTFFESLSESLKESAKIDGANDITILYRIIIPLSTPVIAVMFLFYGVAHWNSWFSAMVYLRDRNLYPLQLILREILVANDTSSMTGSGSVGDFEQIGLTIRYATVMTATIPILMIYPFLQKYFVKGIMIGAIKG